MKVKYLRLNSQERKVAKEKYYQTDTGKYVRQKLKNARLCSILCIVGSLYLIFDAYINNLGILDKIYGFAILIIGFVLLIVNHRIFIKKINEYVVKKK